MNERVKALFQERLDNQLRDTRAQGRENAFITLSDEEAKKMLETNTTLMKMLQGTLDIRVAQGVEDGLRMLSDSAVEVLFKSNARVKAMFREKLDKEVKDTKETLEAEKTQFISRNLTQYQNQVAAAKKQLSEKEIREILSTNPTAKAIFTGNLKKLEIETEKVKASLKAEIAAQLQAQHDEDVRVAKTQLSEEEIRDILSTNTTARVVFRGNLKRELETKREKITTTLIAEFNKKLSATQETGKTATISGGNGLPSADEILGFVEQAAK